MLVGYLDYWEGGFATATETIIFESYYLTSISSVLQTSEPVLQNKLLEL